MSSRSSLMLLSVNGTAQSYGVIPERTDLRDHPVRSSSSRRAVAFDQVTPSLRRRAQHSTRRWLDARSPLAIGDLPANGWSIYGAQRAQPVATGGKWDALEN